MSKILVITDDAGSHITSPGGAPVPYPDAVNMCCGFLTSYIKALKEHPEYTAEDDQSLFNFTNEAFSKQLELAFPEQELRPDITVEALKQAEDNLLAQKAAAEAPIDLNKARVSRITARQCRDHKKGN